MSVISLLRLVWLWTCVTGFTVMAAAVGFADDPERTHRSILEGIPALEKPITCSEFKIPLGELVERVAADTGVRLTAGRDVADEPVEVVVERMPAARLLEQLGDLLDYRWSRSGKQGSWRYEIHQDLAGRQREEAALQALYAKVEEQLHQTLHELIAALRFRLARRFEDAEDLAELLQHDHARLKVAQVVRRAFAFSEAIDQPLPIEFVADGDKLHFQLAFDEFLVVLLGVDVERHILGLRLLFRYCVATVEVARLDELHHGQGAVEIGRPRTRGRDLSTAPTDH